MREMSRERCYGCEIDHPSQTQHMGDGCLGDIPSIANSFLEEAIQVMHLDVNSDYAKHLVAEYND
jgi:hypothetical protein